MYQLTASPGCLSLMLACCTVDTRSFYPVAMSPSVHIHLVILHKQKPANSSSCTQSAPLHHGVVILHQHGTPFLLQKSAEASGGS